MSRDAAKQIASNCACGSPLRWETREDFRERRSIALCQNPDCGVITTTVPEGVAPEEHLATCLLGHVPPRRYLKPWMRLYWKATKWGYTWRSHHQVCPDCAGEVTAQLALPPLMERQTDPYQVVLCLTCGATGMAWWLGEQVAIAIHGTSGMSRPRLS